MRALLSGGLRTPRRIFRALISAVLPVLLGGLAPVLAAARAVAARRAPQPCQGANRLPNAADADAVAGATECLINRVRVAHGLRALHHNPALQRVAGGQVRQMVRWDYFADVRPTGQTAGALIASTRYAAHGGQLATGQNIGWATGTETTPAHMVSAWMHSAPHRAVILAAHFRDIGAGMAPALPSVLRRGSRGAIYAVEFGARGG
jgi:uncharacterized protein YkwD